jgi:alkylation response protein AidB-like acyl-CoA dehydrogenase
LAEIALHAAKSFCADTFFMVAGNMIQLHGGIGFTWEHDAHLFFKRARSIQSMLGNGNVHREAIAAKILGEAA